MRAAATWIPIFCLLLLFGPASHAAEDRCLSGDSTAQDQIDIEALRVEVEVTCACDLAATRGAYRRCAREVVRAGVDNGGLRRKCRSTVNRYHSRSSCGLGADRAPCLKKKQGSAKLRCTIRRIDRCVGNGAGTVRRTACPGYTHCIDAGDTDMNGLVGVGDLLHCAARLETVDIPSSATPPNTPGTPGVVVTNPKLLAQFGPGADLNNARYTRFYAPSAGVEVQPDAILILVPGFEGGAGDFKILAENLIARMRRDHSLVVEVWGYDRRSSQLEDRAGIRIADGLGDPMVALDWLFGDDLGLTLDPALAAGPNRRAVFYNEQDDAAFIANWTPLVFTRDIDVVVTAAHGAAKNGNVFLGGHSAGTGFAARYAATDFNLSGVGPSVPGYEKLRGLVLLEGGGGSTAGGPATADTLDRIEAKFDGGLFGAVRDNQPRCVDGTTLCTVAAEATDCAGLHPPVCTEPTFAYSIVPGLLTPQILAAVEPPAIQARTDPDGGQIILQVDLGAPGNNAVASVPELATLAVLPQSTVSGGIGSFVDDDGLIASLASFVSTSVGAPGPVIGGLTTWLDRTEGPLPAGALPNNGPAPTSLPTSVWGQEKEATDIARLLTTFVAGGTNFTDWYFPSSGLGTTRGLPSLDSSALSIGRGRRDIENLTQAANIDVPVIGLGGSNGSARTPASFLAFAGSIGTCAAPSCDGSARVIDATNPNPAFPTFGDIGGGFEAHISEGFSHVDVLTAEDDADNDVLAPLASFLVRNLQ